MTIKEIKKVIKANPKCFIYYNDNGCWDIWKSKKDFDKLNFKDFDKLNFLENDKYDKFMDKIILISGDDFDRYNGYASLLVTALAELLNIKVDSI